jgi:hypothetical protein
LDGWLAFWFEGMSMCTYGAQLDGVSEEGVMQALWCIIMGIVTSRLRWVEKGAVVESCQYFKLSDET